MKQNKGNLRIENLLVFAKGYYFSAYVPFKSEAAKICANSELIASALSLVFQKENKYARL